MKATLVEAGLEPFRARQVWQWIYWHGVRDFALMTNIARKTQQRLADLFVIERPGIVTEQRSTDGTRKWLLRFADGNEAETVNIPEEDRGSVCVSSQVGCTLTCSFCHTGTQALVRNLTPAEIVGQFMVARDSYGEWPTPTETTRMLSNIVMMGMGEPLYNFDNVATALKIVMDEQGIALSRRRITLSTSGVVPMIPRSARCSTSTSRSRCMPSATRCATRWCRSTANGRSPSCWRPAPTIPVRATAGASPSSTPC